MNRREFRDINRKHIESCKTIIKLGGICSTIECKNCPFYMSNIVKECTDCSEYISAGYRNKKNTMLLESAKEFLELFKNKTDDRMFSNAKVGDKVYHLRHGSGTIGIADKNNKIFGIYVDFENGRHEWMTWDGKESATDKNPTLFHRKPIISFPEPLEDILKSFSDICFPQEAEDEDEEYFSLWYDKEENCIISVNHSYTSFVPSTLLLWCGNIDEQLEFLDKLNSVCSCESEFNEAIKNITLEKIKGDLL